MTALFKSVSGTIAASGASTRRTSRKLTAALAAAGLWKSAATYLTVMLYGLSGSQNEIKGKTAYATYFNATTSCVH